MPFTYIGQFFVCLFVFLAVDDNSTQEERFIQITQTVAVTLLGILYYNTVTCISQCFFSSRDNNIFFIEVRDNNTCFFIKFLNEKVSS